MSAIEPESGVGFLLTPANRHTILSPDSFTDEQRMFLRTAEEFMEKEVMPQNEAIEHLDYGLLRKLMKKAGELGFLSIDIPEEFGGLGLDKTT